MNPGVFIGFHLSSQQQFLCDPETLLLCKPLRRAVVQFRFKQFNCVVFLGYSLDIYPPGIEHSLLENVPLISSLNLGMHQCIDGRALADGEIEWNCMFLRCDKKSAGRLDADPKKQTLCQFKGLNPEIQVLMIRSLYKWQYGCF